MQKHTLLGEQLVSHVPLLQGAGLRVIRSHHERFDGAGYPDHRADGDIPPEARIFAVADALDAMTGERPYRKPVSWDEAIAEVSQGPWQPVRPGRRRLARHVRARTCTAPTSRSSAPPPRCRYKPVDVEPDPA